MNSPQRAAYTYDPYGANVTATALNGPLPANPWRYTGGHLDPTGLYHLNARYYNPTLGTFTQQDSILALGDPSNGNRYAYTGDNPVNRIDPSGRWSWSLAGELAGDAAGALTGLTCAAGVIAAGGGPEDPVADFAVPQACGWVAGATSRVVQAAAY